MRKYIGRSFREKLMYAVPEWYTDEEIADHLVHRAVCVHLGGDAEAKFDVVVFMIKKLFALVQDKCVPEGVDAVMMHEIVLGGHLYLQLLKEKLQTWLLTLKGSILKKARSTSGAFEITPSVMDVCVKVSSPKLVWVFFGGKLNIFTS